MQTSENAFIKSSFQILKQTKQQFTKEVKIRSKKMKKYKFLKDEIYNNRNIFQSFNNVDHFSKTMTAQNIIWKKNYQLKQGINSLKQQNSSLKARIWNVQKENRKMDRQIQAWGLKKTFTNSSSKPYIDTATAEKVLHDQDYSITSIKILIMQMQNDFESLSHTLEQSLILNKNIKNIRNDMNHQLSKNRIQLYKFQLQNSQGQFNKQEIETMRNERRQVLIRMNNELQCVNRNIQFKKGSQVGLQEELFKINSELEKLSEVNLDKISYLKEQAHKLRTEDQSYVNEEVQKLANVKDKYIQFQCRTQDKMGEFIKKKIDLDKKIKKYQHKMKKLQQSTQILNHLQKKSKMHQPIGK